MNNRDSLIEIMVTHKLERREIANLLNVERETVEHWLVPTESAKTLAIPDMAVELLQIKLGTKTAEIYTPEAGR